MVKTLSKTSRRRPPSTPYSPLKFLGWRSLNPTQNRTLLFALLFALGFVGALAIPAWGKESLDYDGLDYLTRITDNITKTASWWDSLWEDTFTPEKSVNSINNRAIMDVVRYVLLAGFITWSWKIGRKIFEKGSDISDWVKFIIPVVLVTFFLANSGQVIYYTAHGMRKIVNAAPSQVAKIQVGSFNVRLAINDALFTQVTRTVISQEAKKCAQLQPPGVNLTEAEKQDLFLRQRLARSRARNEKGSPLTTEERVSIHKQASMNQLQCLNSLEGFILEQKEIIKKGCPDCKTALELTERSQESAQEAIKRNMADFAVQGFDIAKSAAAKTALVVINPGLALAEMIAPDWQVVLTEIAMVMAWAFIASQELALLLAALMGPIAFALGAVPYGQNAIIEWLLFFARVLLVRLAYVILIGFVAVMLAGVVATPLIFPLFFGIFAPIIAYKVVNDGVGAAADSFRSGLVGVGTAGVGIVSGGLIALNSSLQTRAMRYR